MLKSVYCNLKNTLSKVNILMQNKLNSKITVRNSMGLFGPFYTLHQHRWRVYKVFVLMFDKHRLTQNHFLIRFNDVRPSGWTIHVNVVKKVHVAFFKTS